MNFSVEAIEEVRRRASGGVRVERGSALKKGKCVRFCNLGALFSHTRKMFPRC